MIKELDFKNIEEIRKIEKYLKSNNADYMQSIKWNIIRNEKNKYFIYFENNNNIEWTCSLLEKVIDGNTYLYAPRGPILDFKNSEKINSFFTYIEKWIKNKKYEGLIINPIIDYSVLNLFPKDLKYSIRERNDYSKLQESCKLAIMPIIYDQEKLLNKLPSKFRQNIRRSTRKNLFSKISKNVDFENFYKLYLETSIRHDFRPHDMEYFKKIVDIFKDDLIFIEVWYDKIPLAMSIDILNNDKLIYLYGVSASEHRNLLGMYNMQFEAMKYCISNRIPYYDFGGVFCEENDVDNKDFGLYNFKKGFCYTGFIDICSDIVVDFR